MIPMKNLKFMQLEVAAMVVEAVVEDIMVEAVVVEDIMVEAVVEVGGLGVPHGGIHTHTIGGDPNTGGGLHHGVVVAVSTPIQD